MQVIAAKLQQFVKEIQAGGPAQGTAGGQTEARPRQASKQESKQTVVPDKDKEKRNHGRIGRKRTFETTEKFYARPQDIFECFVNPQKITAYTQSPAQVRSIKATVFSQAMHTVLHISYT